MESIYESRRSDGARCIYINIKILKDWLSHSKDTNMDAHTNTHTHKKEGDLISLLIFFQGKKRRLKTGEDTQISLYKAMDPILLRGSKTGL
jgi:hypothetical protein